MSDTFGIIERLTEVERAEFDALDKTPPPEELLKELRKPASVGWVRTYVGTHSRWCPAQRKLRMYGIAVLVLIGAVLGLNVAGALNYKTVLRTAAREGFREELKETVKQEVRDALKEFGIQHARLEKLTKESVAQGTP